MDTKVNYTVVGFFVVLLSVAMVLIFFWLSELAHHKTYDHYLVYAKGGVNGLNVQSPVQFNGVRVGVVEDIKIDTHNPQLVKIFLKLEIDTPVTESTTATLIPQGITGLVYVGLNVSTAQASQLKPKPGERYAVIPYEKPVLVELAEVLPELAENVQDISDQLKYLLSTENIHNISEILSHLDLISTSFAQKIDVLLENGLQISQSLNSTLATTRQTMQGFDVASQTLLPSIQNLLTHLDEVTEHVNELVEDLERNPSILIRGKQPLPKGPGE